LACVSTDKNAPYKFASFNFLLKALTSFIAQIYIKNVKNKNIFALFLLNNIIN
jgi:hypothetical protein